MNKAKRILKKAVPKKFRRDEKPSVGIPRITNETLAEHREEVLAGARKFMYPLTHSKHKVVVISTVLIVMAIVSFFTFTMLSLYRWQATSNFMYQITKIVPFPVARAGSSFVSYESYLFELRRYIHYYETQENVNFDDETAQLQLNDYKKRSLDRVVNDAYIRKMAREHNVSISDQEVNAQIQLLRDQNRLGNNNDVFEDVLQDFWGWTVDDFRRSLRQQMLAQKVNAKLDTETTSIAAKALSEVKAGGDFATLAAQYSQDPATKDLGGVYGFEIDTSTREIPPQLFASIFSLKAGEISELIDVGYGLEIVKVLETDGKKVKAAHILFNYKDINTFINDAKASQKTRIYIKKPD